MGGPVPTAAPSRPECGPVMRRPAAAEYIGLSRRTLETLDRDGRGPARIRLGRVVGYLRGDLDAWLASRRVVVTS